MSDEYVPTTDEIRLAWWMTPDNPADNEGASDLSFDRWLADHDAELWDEGYTAAERDDERITEEGLDSLTFEARNPYRAPIGKAEAE